MSKLEKDLPKIIKTALKEEDQITRTLVNTLLQQVIISYGKSDPYPAIKKSIEDAIDREISVGNIDLENF